MNQKIHVLVPPAICLTHVKDAMILRTLVLPIVASRVILVTPPATLPAVTPVNSASSVTPLAIRPTVTPVISVLCVMNQMTPIVLLLLVIGSVTQFVMWSTVNQGFVIQAIAPLPVVTQVLVIVLAMSSVILPVVTQLHAIWVVSQGLAMFVTPPAAILARATSLVTRPAAIRAAT
jgi:hypothetical protein